MIKTNLADKGLDIGQKIFVAGQIASIPWIKTRSSTIGRIYRHALAIEIASSIFEPLRMPLDPMQIDDNRVAGLPLPEAAKQLATVRTLDRSDLARDLWLSAVDTDYRWDWGR